MTTISEENIAQASRMLRRLILAATTKAGSGHPTSCFSAVELMSCLMYAGYVHYDPTHPKSPASDTLIFSKGHAAPLLYALHVLTGHITEDELYTLRSLNSSLEGHPTPRFPYTRFATGSLGQGLSLAIGTLLGQQLLQKQGKLQGELPRAFVLLGDSECVEGQVWEAAAVASYYNLSRLIAIVDINRLGQRGETMENGDGEIIKNKFAAFGWNTLLIENGHDITHILNAYQQIPTNTNKPLAIIAKTIKGKGLKLWEDKNGWHGKPLPQEKLGEALKEIGEIPPLPAFSIPQPQCTYNGFSGENNLNNVETPSPTPEIPTREAYGKALVALGKVNDKIVVLDAETSNSTYAELFKDVFPERYFEMYIAEQNMASVAVGLASVGFVPYCSSFGAFLTRAFDQVRMAQYSGYHLVFAGSHAGTSIGQDGASQMALEDMSMFSSLFNSTVYYPSDTLSTFAAVMKSFSAQGLQYIRLTRQTSPTLYTEPGQIRSLTPIYIYKENTPQLAIFTAGYTHHLAIPLIHELYKRGLPAALIDTFIVSPLDSHSLSAILQKNPTLNTLVVIEDHGKVGGIGSSVSQALHELNSPLSLLHFYIKKVPVSASTQDVYVYEDFTVESLLLKILSFLKKG